MPEELKVGIINVVNVSLVIRELIIFQSLHIQFDIMKQFVKTLDKSGECFNIFSCKFLKLSSEKMKVDILDGPQIIQLVKDPSFVKSMTDVESKEWNSFMFVISNFLGEKKSK